MPTKKLEELGVVEIYPRPGNTQHRLQSGYAGASGDDRAISQEQQRGMWRRIEAYDFKCQHLAEVISENIEAVGTALVIVHMTDKQEKEPTISQQVAAIQEATKKRISIYVAMRESPLAEEPTFSPRLQRAIGNYGQTYYFSGSSGNALYAKDGGNVSLRDVLASRFVRAIVFGQALGQCVDSTILGLWLTTITPGEPTIEYQRGLLDLSIAVVTARNVLLPTNEVPSRYFEFEVVNERYPMQRARAQPAQTRRGSLTPLGAATRAAVKCPSVRETRSMSWPG